MPATSQPSHLIAATSAGLFLVVSMVGALVAVALKDWFGVGDLKAMLIWSAAATPFAFGVVRLLLRFTPGWTRIASFLGHGVAAVGFVIAWSAVMAVSLGPLVGAFSFPVPLLWLLGALVGFMAAALLVHRRGWLLAGSISGLLLLGAVTLAIAKTTRPPDIIVVLKAGLPSAERERVWCEVLGHPHPSGVGCSPLAGIETTSAFDGNGASRYRIGFHAGTAMARRMDIVRDISRSSLVDRVEDYDPAKHGVVDFAP